MQINDEPLFGILDGLKDNTLLGWASYGPTNKRAPKVILQIDGTTIASQEAKLPRAGVKQRGLHPTGRCGFSFSLDLIPESLRNEPQTVAVKLEFADGSCAELRNSPQAVIWETCYQIPQIRKLFFMHIAKAAGTSANAMMSQQYAPHACVTHIETQFRDLTPSQVRAFDFVSGHIEAPIARKLGLSNHVWATLFRLPKPHLFSHINWVRHIGADPDSEFHKVHSRPVRELSLRLAAVQPGESKALMSIMDYKNQTVRTLFDNRQTRYLLPRNTTRVSERLLGQAFKRLAWFDLVGTIETIDCFNQELSQLIGHKDPLELPELNKQQHHQPLDFRDFDEHVLLPFIQYDRQLYKRVTELVSSTRGRNATGRRQLMARQPAPLAYLEPRLTNVEQARHPSRKPCTQLGNPSNSANKTFVVLGVSRGGTSLFAGLLTLFGIHMGDKLSPGSHEDVAFHTKNVSDLKKLIQNRNQHHAQWGWKYPHTLDYLGKIKTNLRNPHYIVVYRDVLSVAQGFNRHDGTAMKDCLADAQKRYAALTRFVTHSSDPVLAISYEKSIADPNSLIRELSKFCGVSLTLEQRALCLQFIEPGQYTPLSKTLKSNR